MKDSSAEPPAGFRRRAAAAATGLAGLWGRLTALDPALRDPEERRQAQLTSAVVLTSAALIAAVLGVQLLASLDLEPLWPPSRLTWRLAGLLLVLAIVALSRTRRHQVAAAVVVVFSTASALGYVAVTPDQPELLGLLPVGVLVSSLLLPVRVTLAVCAATLAEVTLLALSGRGLGAYGAGNVVTMVTLYSSLAVVGAWLREAHLRQLRARNAELAAARERLAADLAEHEQRGAEIVESLIAVASGELSRRAPVRSAVSTFDALAAGVNVLAEEVEARVAELAAANAQLQAEVAARQTAEGDARQHSARAETLLSVAARLNVLTDLDSVLRAICQETVAALGVRAAVVHLHDEPSAELRAAAAAGLPPGLWQRLPPVPLALFGRLAREQGPVLLVHGPDSLAELPGAAQLAALGAQAVAAAGIVREGGLLGSLGVVVARPAAGEFRDLSTDERALLLGLADLAAQAIANARLAAVGADRLRTLSALYDSARRLAASADAAEAVEQIAAAGVTAFGARLAWVGRAEPDGGVRVLGHYPPGSGYPRGLGARWDDTPEGRGPTGQAIRASQPVVVDDVGADPAFAPWRERALAAGYRSVACIPLAGRERTFGVLALYADQTGAFTPERLELFGTYGYLAAATLENARLLGEARHRATELERRVFQRNRELVAANAALERARAALAELAIRDELTGTYNRREFERLLAEEVERVRRAGSDYSATLVMLDIDHFKRVNDSHGHPAGDAVLRGLGRLLTSSLRSLDRPARYGGEELAVIAPGLTPDEGEALAERLRRLIEAQRFPITSNGDRGAELAITVSLGVAGLPADAATAPELVAAADRALYQAKRAGRNRVVRASRA